MRQLILVATGCSPETPKPTSCQIEERLVEPAGRAKLSIRDVQFADVAGPFVRLDVRVTDGTAHRVPIYVRARGQVTRIGTTKPDANFLLGASRAGELEIQLGGTALPFLKRKDLQQCRYP